MTAAPNVQGPMSNDQRSSNDPYPKRLWLDPPVLWDWLEQHAKTKTSYCAGLMCFRF